MFPRTSCPPWMRGTMWSPVKGSPDFAGSPQIQHVVSSSRTCLLARSCAHPRLDTACSGQRAPRLGVPHTRQGRSDAIRPYFFAASTGAVDDFWIFGSAIGSDLLGGKSSGNLGEEVRVLAHERICTPESLPLPDIALANCDVLGCDDGLCVRDQRAPPMKLGLLGSRRDLVPRDLGRPLALRNGRIDEDIRVRLDARIGADSLSPLQMTYCSAASEAQATTS
jgi:hypothetical protein